MSERSRHRPLLYLCAALLAAPLPAQDPTPPEKPFLWRIEGEVPSFLFGTIHLPDERVTTLHPAVERAVDRCDALFTELPLDHATMLGSMKLMVLPGRKTLEDVLPQRLYGRLEAFLSERGMPIAPLSRLKVWAIAAQVPLIDHLSEIAGGEALDVKLYRLADDDAKDVGGLETVEEQVGVFDSLDEAEQAQLLTDALDQYDELAQKGEDPVEKLIDLYRTGDEVAIMEMMRESESPDTALQEKVEEALLWTRNRRMAERIAARISDEPETSFFFAVGAAHMPADRGVIRLLERQGFTVTRLPETVEALERRIRALEAELERLRARLGVLRKAG